MVKCQVIVAFSIKDLIFVLFFLYFEKMQKNLNNVLLEPTSDSIGPIFIRQIKKSLFKSDYSGNCSTITYVIARFFSCEIET